MGDGLFFVRLYVLVTPHYGRYFLWLLPILCIVPIGPLCC
jgi:hypothetical protein